MSRITIAVAALGAVLLACLLGLAYHRGAVSRDPEVADAKAQAVTATQQVNACGAALTVANEATAAAQKVAETQRGLAAAAIEAAANASKATQSSLDGWTRQYTAAQADATCKAQLEQTLCPSVPSY